MEELRAASVVLESTMYEFDKPYDYLIPINLPAAPGCRVTVPFGSGNRIRQGMILTVHTAAPDSKLKTIAGVIDDAPILDTEMLRLCEWLHEHTFCTYFDAVRTVLPVGISLKSNETYKINPDFSGFDTLSENKKAVFSFISGRGSVTRAALGTAIPGCSDSIRALITVGAITVENSLSRRVSEATQKCVCLACEESELDRFTLTPRQSEVARLAEAAGQISVKELQYFTGVSVGVISALEKKGVLKTFQKDVYRTPYRFSQAADNHEIVLNSEQSAAYESILASINSGGVKPWLLYGITGSGKTQVFLKLVDYMTGLGRGVIIMVPEIALTPQTIQIFGNRYGSRIAVFHSAMSLGQRMDEWRRVKGGEATIAIGTRSAVFAPVKNTGLIIMDEEHEHSYKSEASPRFHARDVAKFRSAYNNALLVLASATPSVESFSAAKAGHYNMAVLKNRYANALLPKVLTVDMRSQIVNGNKTIFSTDLINALRHTLDAGEQAILLLNRRGHNTFVSCPTCGEVATCPNCSISLTYHSANGRLMCHYCGYSVPADEKCPKCSGRHLKYMGAGTQKAEQELEQLFPDASILRLDADTTLARNSFDEKLSDFAGGKYNVMLGTQMVAKGLNFPRVTLVGVLGIDGAMYSTDFRSFERAFSLLTQVMGRAGRGDKPGTALIQTIHPDDSLITLAASQDYEAFYEQEISTRKLMVYPPYCDMVQVCVTAPTREAASGTATAIFENIKRLLNSGCRDIKLIILGPSPASMPRVNNRYRYRMIIKSRDNAAFRALLRQAISVKRGADVSVFVDINPESIL